MLIKNDFVSVMGNVVANIKYMGAKIIYSSECMICWVASINNAIASIKNAAAKIKDESAKIKNTVANIKDASASIRWPASTFLSMDMLY